MTVVADSQAFSRAIEQREAQVLSRLMAEYVQLASDLQRQLTALGKVEPGSMAKLYQQERLLNMQQQVRTTMTQLAGGVAETGEALSTQAVGIGVADGVALVGEVAESGIGSTFIQPNPAALEASLGAQSKLSPIYQALAEEGAEAIGRRIAQGVYLGQSPALISSGIRKELGTNAVKTLMLTRTETGRAYNAGRHEAFRANADAADLEGWTWVAKLGPRSCAACWAMHGTDHPLTETMDSHPGCRCAPAPKPRGTSVEILKGEDVFAKLSRTEKRNIFKNEGLFQEYRSGRISLMDVVGRRQSAAFGTMRYQRSLTEILSGRNQNWIGTGPVIQMIPDSVQGYIRREGPPSQLDLDEVSRKVQELREAGSFGGIYRDDGLLDILDAQGFTGKPELVDAARFEQLVGEGWTKTYRGVSGPDALTVDGYVRDWAKGDVFPGLGAYGNGTYTTTSLDYATQYVQKGNNGKMIEMAVRSDAKIINYRDLDDMMDAEWDSLSEALQDPGRYAAYHGYDAILKTRPGGDFLVVLNRTATAMVTS